MDNSEQASPQAVSNVKINYNPDVLSCLANLSNDEVFTPPELVNQMLDLLPADLWQNPDAKFLDPVTKSGVFLREIAKRLIAGLKDQIPDQQMRINHIFQKQLYGIAITELTSLLARRSVYCSKFANGQYAIVEGFDNPQGNILFSRTQHTWNNQGKCTYCGASQAEYDRDAGLESYAYQFIHTEKPQTIFGKDMKFDVIIGNPPYHLNDGGAQASAIPLYHKFVQQAKKLNPAYLLMIIPSRWFAGGKGLDSFRDEMLNDKHIQVLHDFTNSKDCFPSLGDDKIKGGVCYFLRSKDSQDDCEIYTHTDGKVSTAKRPLLEKGFDTFIRYNDAISILNKIRSLNEETMDTVISARKPFDLTTDFRNFISTPFNESIKIYANKKIGFVSKSLITKNIGWIGKHKVIAPYAIGTGDSKTDKINPIYAEPESCCTETYIILGLFSNKDEAENLISYINTRFFHFALTLKKNTQHATSKAYSFVPVQDFTESWADEKLYKKYNLTAEEIAFIESMIRPMELADA
jgi:site-specific DNA-methyltransferase (adenine-specific)